MKTSIALASTQAKIGPRPARLMLSGPRRNFDRVCDGDRYDDRVTEIVDAALERGYLLAFRERAGGWEAAWRPTTAVAAPPMPPAFASTRTAAAERALAAIRAAA